MLIWLVPAVLVAPLDQQATPTPEATPTPTPEASPQAGQRQFNPADIQVPQGFAVEVFATGLNYPADITFSDTGEIYVAEAGEHTYGTTPEESPPPRIVQIMPDGSTQVVYDQVVSMEEIRNNESSADMPEGLIPPITGVTWHDGQLYVTHRTRVSTLDPNTGEFRTIINGLPSWGFFHNYKVIFGPDDMMYFFLSSQGNAGPIDEHWMKVIQIFNKRQAHEIPCADVTLTGQNFPVPVEDPSTPNVRDTQLTGVFVPLGEVTEEGQTIPGQIPCNTAFFRANPDGTGLELVAWGFRSNFGYRFSPDGQRLVTTQNSGNPIPPREIHNDYEPIYEVVADEWYGRPDYYSSIPITDELFNMPLVPRNFVLTEETHRQLLQGQEQPRQPLAVLQPHSAAEGMVFGRQEFGIPENNILVAELGTIVIHMDSLPGFRVQRVDLDTGQVSDFLVNRNEKPASATGGGGLERPIQLEWGPDGSLYVVDFGVINLTPQGMQAQANTGAIWRVSRTNEEVVLEEPRLEEAQPPADARVVPVDLTEYELNMPNLLPAGPTVFEVTNTGRIAHSFEIEGQGMEQVLQHRVKPGETALLQVDLQPGTYTAYCPVFDHQERGMKLEVRVVELE